MSKQPRRWVKEISPPERLDQIFLISQPQLRNTTRGDLYIAAYLSDKSGKINGRMWQASEALFKSLPDEGFVKVKGNAESYQNNVQMIINAIQPVDASEVDMEDFLAASEFDVDEMFERLLTVLRTVKNPHLLELIKLFLDDSDLMAIFKKAPAASNLHHAYLGGLLEHTLSLLELSQRILPHYPKLNADLVIVGLFLHDIGKTKELACDISFKYTDQGQLLGHIVQGLMMIQEKIAQIDNFPVDLKNALLHIIASHHGIKEYGSPVTPAMPEAFAVHHIDNLDSKITMTTSMIENDLGEGRWTPYIRALEMPLFKVRPDDFE